jgi:hypothetical protein
MDREGFNMKPQFVAAKPSKLSWVDQFLFLPGAVILCVILPIADFFGRGDDFLLRRWPLSTWLLIGLGFLLFAIIERLALIIVELKTITFLCSNLFKDADATDFSVNLLALNRMRQTVRQALGAPDDEAT